MARRKHKPEEIVAKLRQVDVLTSQGRSVAELGSNDRRNGRLPITGGAGRNMAG